MVEKRRSTKSSTASGTIGGPPASSRKNLRRKNSKKAGQPTQRQKKAERRRIAAAAREMVRDKRQEPVEYVRPTIESVMEVIEAVADGDTARGKCRELSLNYREFRKFIEVDEKAEGGGSLRALYEAAKKERPESWAEMMVEIASKPFSHEAVVLGATGAEQQQRSTLIGVYRWLAGKYNIKFSDKQTTVLEGNPEAPLLHGDLKDLRDMPLEQLAEALRQRTRSAE